MRAVRVRILALAVAVLLLVAQVAPMLWRMDCLVSDRSVLSWGTARSCMPAQKKGHGDELAPTCCVFSRVGGERTEFIKQGTPVPLDLQHTWALPAAPLLLPAQAREARVLNWVRPPPDLAEDRSILHRQLLI